MRVMEGMRLGVKDVDFARREILIRDGKGLKDRVTVLPRVIEKSLRKQLDHAHAIHRRDLNAGYGEVWLPGALERKYRSAAREWGWQSVFPAEARSPDPRTGVIRRHHLSDQALQRAMRQAVRDAALTAAFLRHAPARIRLRHPHRACGCCNA